jgi:hypothetical protein
LADSPVSAAEKGPRDVIAWRGVELGYGPPCAVPYWKYTFTVVAVPGLDRAPFNVAEFDVTSVALPVETVGGIGDVVKLISFP